MGLAPRAIAAERRARKVAPRKRHWEEAAHVTWKRSMSGECALPAISRRNRNSRINKLASLAQTLKILCRAAARHRTNPTTKLMPASAPYIPARDGEFDAWFANFNSLITATPTNYGLVAGDAVIIDAQFDIWHPAYVLLTVPATNNSPNVAAKDVARANALAVIRPYAQRVRANAGVSDALKVGLGLNLQPATLTPIPVPPNVPVLQSRGGLPQKMIMAFNDSILSGKVKPYGAVQIELAVKYSTAASVDPDTALLLSLVTKSPVEVSWPSAERGKVATVWGRYRLRSGPGGISQAGSWSDPLVVTVT